MYTEALKGFLHKAGASKDKIKDGVKIIQTCWTSDRCNGRPIAPPRQAQISLDKCSAHTWFPELIVPVATFLTEMTDSPKAPHDGFFS